MSLPKDCMSETTAAKMLEDIDHPPVHLCLPARYETRSSLTCPVPVTLEGWNTSSPAMGSKLKPGELLFPALFDEARTNKLEG